jgi:hypothetical protein
LSFLAILLPTPVFAIDKYLCIADKATGFAWNGSAWVTTAFKVEEKRYLVGDADPRQTQALNHTEPVAVTVFGESFPSIWCAAPKFDVLNCEGYGERIRINLNSLRFITVYMVGFVSGKDDNSDTPSMTIGRCSKL